MNRKDLLDKIKYFLSVFQLQVEISTDNNEYDINIHSENALIPLFNILLNGNFESLHYVDKNAQGIDLFDSQSGVAIQVTSTKKITKIKDTLHKLIKAKYWRDVKKLYIFILTTKQGSYSQSPLRAIIGNSIIFNVKNNILDNKDLYRLIQSITDIDKLKEIEILLKKNFSELYLSENFSQNDYNDFKIRYSRICKSNFSRLNFFGLSIQKRPREVDLHELFVEPVFSVSGNNSFFNTSFKYKIRKNISINLTDLDYKIPETSKLDNYKLYISKEFDNEKINKSKTVGSLDFKDLFSPDSHLVLLGNPGAGKSSIIKYTICKILEKDCQTFSDKKIYETLPFRVEIHKYNQFKIERKLGIIDYISCLLSDEYQLDLSSKDLNQIFKYYKTTVFFDGLDEVFDIQQRLLVRNDIESFVQAFAKVRSVVTSRYESYTEVSLDENLFIEMEVQDFSEKQINSYVNKWYNLEEKNESLKREEILNCLKQLKHVDDELKRNPLLLSLILILYRNELEIPTSKLEIYENCTTTIVDHRDNKEKKLLFNLTISNPVAIFSALAYWQFDHLNKELLSKDIHLFVKNELLKKGEIEEDYEASRAAEEFLEFAKVRSIYFENKFTHKTFLEYFTSYFIYSSLYSKPQNISQLEILISKNLSLSSWAVVLELLICKIDSMQIDFEIIDSIIEKQLQVNGDEAVLFFLNIIRYLRNVSPSIKRKLINQGIFICLSSHSINSDGKSESVENIFNSLVSLSKIQRFQTLIKTCFANLTLNGNIDKENLTVFAYEFEISNRAITLTNYLVENSNYNPSIYVELLKEYQQNENNIDYLFHIRKTIKQNNGDENIRFNFKSKYGSAIFRGSKRTNIVTAYLYSQDQKNLISSYETLLKEGIPFSYLKEVIIDLPAHFFPENIFEEYARINDKDLKKLIKITIDAYKEIENSLKINYKIEAINKLNKQLEGLKKLL